MNKFLVYSVCTLSAMAIWGASTAIADHHMEKGAHKPKDMKSKLYDKVDTNEDGKISKEEYLADAANKFDSMDSNADGFISKEEMKEFREKMRSKFKEHRKGDDNQPPPPPPAE